MQVMGIGKGGGTRLDSELTQVVTTARQVETNLDERLHCLELVEGADIGRRYLIGSSSMTIGRAPPADIVLGDSELSRLHCRVSRLGEDLVVADLKSTNGTFIDGVKVLDQAVLNVGAILQVGAQSFKHEWLTGRQFKKSDELDRDLATAFSYVHALLPPPLRDGPIKADWLYQPCTKLGGDAFGYGALGEGRFFGYLIDVSGHGAAAAMHGVGVMNLLRQRAVPADMSRPAEVLQALNTMFQMEDHAEMYFSMWYGVFDSVSRRLDFASAGHHPGFLIPPDRSAAIPLLTKNGLIGATPGARYKADSVTVPPGASIYVFSDGVFEIVTRDGLQWRLADFVPLILQSPIDGLKEPERLFRAVRGVAQPGDLDDDFSLVIMTFD